MGTKSLARYDGLADWYEDYNAPAAAANQAAIGELLGPGEGPCLDLGCGGGSYFEAIRATGRSVVGLDYSADQLRIARGRRADLLVRADAAALPFADAVFPAVAGLWVSSDVDNFAAVVKEAARVLKPGGLLAYYGVHPCFNGPHVQVGEDGARIVHPMTCAALVGQRDDGEQRRPRHQRQVEETDEQASGGRHVAVRQRPPEQERRPQRGEHRDAGPGRDQGGRTRDRTAAEQWNPARHHLAPGPHQAERDQGRDLRQHREEHQVRRPPPARPPPPREL
ncbi:methyltransferase domain-containing protein [Nonomuraea sp. NPDC050404]|uniref:class I SAM-dependent methyltransferase n=1 Tax=Nonomuraea sp. NPDC050404 TaxID=3155783 RepID=UPI0033ED92C7